MDLTTTARVKDYLGITNANQDLLIARLITRASGQIAKFCTRKFDRQSFVAARYNGNGGQRLFLPNAPITVVGSVSVDGVDIPASADGIVAGYQFDDRMIYLFGGYVFARGFRNVVVSYTTAFASGETGTIPSESAPTLTPTSAEDDDGAGFAYSDRGVTFSATGIALSLVATAPVTGQYSFAGGTYTFAEADAGLGVVMTYDYVPGAVEQACIELVALKIKQRDNIGISSRSLANESISYTDRDMSKSVQGMLAPYNRRVPV
jgi:hypothetical protein